MKNLLAPLLIALLAGCATAPPPPPVARPRPAPPKAPAKPPKPALEIDRSYSAKGQSSRVKFIIVHYTVSNLPRSLKTLTQDTVSSHYLLTDEPNPVVFALVDETRQSNHAGVSAWKNYTLLNGSSVGIEIVNPGFTEGPTGRIYYPFPQAQIDKLIALMKGIAARHQVPPENILGHSDIAPQRKQDPGPLFPWWQLAKHGLVQWPDAARVVAGRALYEQQLPDVRWFQQKLATHGYALPQSGVFDEPTRNVISAFQMKYRPSRFDGTPDAETAAMLEAMNPTPLPLVPAMATPAPLFPAPLVRPPLVRPPVAPTPVNPIPVVPAPVLPAPVVAPPATPAPVVPAPVIPAPVIPAPVIPAPAPVVPLPATPLPVPAAPAAPAAVPVVPVVPAVPAAPVPETPAPVVPAPVVPAPETPAPVVPAPETPAPAAPAPTAQTPLVPAPVRP